MRILGAICFLSAIYVMLPVFIKWHNFTQEFYKKFWDNFLAQKKDKKQKG